VALVTLQQPEFSLATIMLITIAEPTVGDMGAKPPAAGDFSYFWSKEIIAIFIMV